MAIVYYTTLLDIVKLPMVEYCMASQCVIGHPYSDIECTWGAPMYKLMP